LLDFGEKEGAIVDADVVGSLSSATHFSCFAGPADHEHLQLRHARIEEADDT
jgi:hypothetical protein